MPRAIFGNNCLRLAEDLIARLKGLGTELVRANIIVPQASLKAWLAHAMAQQGLSLLHFSLTTLDERFLRSKAALVPSLSAFFADRGDPAPFHRAMKLRVACAARLFLGARSAIVDDALLEDFEHSIHFPSLELGIDEASTTTFLFGFSSINRAVLSKLMAIKRLDSLYLLSPCMLFWGDQASDQEIHSLLAKATHGKGALEEMLLDRNRLLANCGQVGREFHLLIEESPIQTASLYTVAHHFLKSPYLDHLQPCTEVYQAGMPPTLLDHIKADLLFLIENRPIPQPLPPDRSVEIHAAPTPFREVEALREYLASLSPLQPASVIVLATDMATYTQAFDYVFGGKIEYQVWGKNEWAGIFSAFRLLTQLLASKSAVHSWTELLRHPVFQRALRCSQEEAAALIEWILSTPLTWGISRNQAANYLAQRGIPSSRDKKLSGFELERDTLLSSFLSGSEKISVDSSLLTPLGSLFHCIDLLESFWKLPIDPAEQASMGEVSCLCSKLVYLLADGRGGYEEEALLYAADTFEAIAQHSPGAPLQLGYAFQLFFQVAQNFIDNASMSLKAPIILAEFGAFHPFPAKVIAVLGANEGAIAQHNEERVLSGIEKLPATLSLSSLPLDKYAFLEAVISAEALFLGYQSYDFELRIAKSYAPMVGELLNHIQRHYSTELTIKNHQIAPAAYIGRQKRFAPPKDLPPFLPLETRDTGALTLVRRAAASALDLFFREQFGLSSPRKEEPSLFKKPWEERKAIEKELEDGEEVLEKLRPLGITRLKRYTVNLHPALSQLTIDESQQTILVPPIHWGKEEVFGCWRTMHAEGTLIVGGFWKQLLFTKWPEVSMKELLRTKYALPWTNQVLLLEEGKIVPITAAPTMEQWLEFSKMAKTIPFPFSYEIVEKLIEGASMAEIEESILEKASAKQGAWQAFASMLQEAFAHFSLWQAWATTLWGPLFALKIPPGDDV